jgi:hypothetical protein
LSIVRELARQRREGSTRYVHMRDPAEVTYWREPGPIPLPDADEMTLLSECAAAIIQTLAQRRLPVESPGGRAPDDIYPAY